MIWLDLLLIKFAHRGEYESRGIYRVKNQNREIILSSDHAVYLEDIRNDFDYYFNAVKPTVNGETQIVDYSSPRLHWIKKFTYFPIHTPSLPESMETIFEYLKFAELRFNAVVLDLGAYSGLSGIKFDQSIPGRGTVISVEPDPKNIPSCRENFAKYENTMGRKIILEESAIWTHDKGLRFSSEGNTGSAPLSRLGGRGTAITVPTITLSQLVEKHHLSTVDFIKCDIEGGELTIFEDPDFFSQFQPKIIIECHNSPGILDTSIGVSNTLAKYGYSFESVNQPGISCPLLCCSPEGGNLTSTSQRPMQYGSGTTEATSVKVIGYKSDWI